MRILGIDPGLASLGYGVVDIFNNQKQMLGCGVIQTDKKRAEGDRLVEISRDIRTIVKLWRPELASIEQFFFYRSNNTVSILQARGVAILTLAYLKIPIVEFTPMQVKLTLVGSGNAKKYQVLETVMKELQLKSPPSPDDAADALAIALTGWFHR
uniref:Holliday junction resolvase RuvC n=1 Tax=Paulinella chromatophora TaxID=39717 RepID=B1X5G2_PAUCH|nr:Holliday junction resolvase RuvC [Paulinella chromatophora]ACB43181.1 Holliday junction resolvase RuvC [Paulinella chromatophora]